jgi:hypothetical protein
VQHAFHRPESPYKNDPGTAAQDATAQPKYNKKKKVDNPNKHVYNQKTSEPAVEHG